METSKYNSKVKLFCPICDCPGFDVGTSLDKAVEIAICASCGQGFTEAELIRLNDGIISGHVDKIVD